MADIMAFVERDMAWRNLDPLSPVEQKNVLAMVEAGLMPGVISSRVLRARGLPEGSQKAVKTSPAREPRLRLVALSDWEHAILGRAVGRLLQDELVPIGHARRLLDKLLKKDVFTTRKHEEQNR